MIRSGLVFSRFFTLGKYTSRPRNGLYKLFVVITEGVRDLHVTVLSLLCSKLIIRTQTKTPGPIGTPTYFTRDEYGVPVSDTGLYLRSVVNLTIEPLISLQGSLRRLLDTEPK